MYLSVFDRLLGWLARLAVLLVFLVVVFIFVFLIRESWPAVESLGLVRFFRDPAWYPLSGQFNLISMIVATLLVAGGAVAIATPIGLSVAIYAQYFASRRVGWWFQRATELLAGIPSVIFGLWGLISLAPRLAWLGGSGQCLLAGMLVLATMILPTLAFSAMAALRSIPENRILGAMALGMSRRAVVTRVALHSARFGIANGVLLALGRALGETMAVLMVAGNVPGIPDSLMDPVRTLTANMALEMGYATADHRSVLFVSGLLLMLIVGSLALLTFFLEERGDAPN